MSTTLTIKGKSTIEEFTLKGYTMDDESLKNGGSSQRTPAGYRAMGYRIGAD